jgi:hypothetical protein
MTCVTFFSDNSRPRKEPFPLFLVLFCHEAGAYISRNRCISKYKRCSKTKKTF